jgi:DNA-binding CsgD family transcriptional regulator
MVIFMFHENLETLLSKSVIECTRFYRWTKDKNGKYIACNEDMIKALGLQKSEEILGLTDFDLCWTSVAEIFKQNDDKVIATQNPQAFFEKTLCIHKKEHQSFSYKIPLTGRFQKIIGTTGSALVIQTENVELLQSASTICKKDNLSKRQLDCLIYLAKGMTAKETSKILNLSCRTIEYYIAILKDKLNCKSKSDLIKKALTLEIVKAKLFL